jgi:mannan endo-1,4-beta-mannosidase
MTVDHLRDVRGLRHLLFAFSPSGGDVAKVEQYLYGYPGDDYVDVLGGDYYYVADSERMNLLVELMVGIAEARGKVAALTEFGPRNGINGFMVPSDNWMTERLLQPLLSSEHGLGIAYALAWRNARPDHAFLPYPGHVGEQDLASFCRHPAVVMQRDLQPVSRVDAAGASEISPP